MYGPERGWHPVGAVDFVDAGGGVARGRGPAYHGAFPAMAVVTALLLLGLQQPGRVATVLSSWPFVALGKVSYGVYLYHFPTFVLMRSQRVGQAG